MTTDNKQIKVKSHNIEKVVKPKYQGYQESGVDLENDSRLAIQGTPFELDGDK